MTDINFTSTYRISISQPGINAAKKARLRELVESYPNGLIGRSKVGYARVSITDNEDANFIAKLKSIGYKIYQKFEGENISKEDLDVFIKRKLDTKDFNQKGKNPPKLSSQEKKHRRMERSFDYVQEEKIPTEEPEILSQKSDFISTPKEHKSRSTFGRPELTQDEIRQSKEYLDIVAQDGKEFAEAMFFGIKK